MNDQFAGPGGDSEAMTRQDAGAPNGAVEASTEPAEPSVGNGSDSPATEGSASRERARSDASGGTETAENAASAESSGSAASAGTAEGAGTAGSAETAESADSAEHLGVGRPYDNGIARAPRAAAGPQPWRQAGWPTPGRTTGAAEAPGVPAPAMPATPSMPADANGSGAASNWSSVTQPAAPQPQAVRPEPQPQAPTAQPVQSPQPRPVRSQPAYPTTTPQTRGQEQAYWAQRPDPYASPIARRRGESPLSARPASAAQPAVPEARPPSAPIRTPNPSPASSPVPSVQAPVAVGAATTTATTATTGSATTGVATAAAARPGQPGDATPRPERITLAYDDEDDAIAEESRRATPRHGFKGALYKLTRINLGPSKRDLDELDIRERLNRQARRTRGYCGYIGIASEKGGVGKTTLASLLAAEIAEGRRESVGIADLNPDLGTLPDRFGVRPHYSIRDLLAHVDEIPWRYHVHDFMEKVPEMNVRVLAASTDRKMRHQLSVADVELLAELFAPFFSFAILDNGTHITHEAMLGTLRIAHGMVLVTDNTRDGANLARKTLQFLTDNGYPEMRRRVVLAVVAKETASPIKVRAIEKAFRDHVRELVIVPYDPALDGGGKIPFRDPNAVNKVLRKETRQAVRRLAAVVMDDLVS